MKPAFALDFRNDAIALLHRTSGGWHQVGRVTFDEPDLPAALSYLRATALGLSPRGLATKLILPDDQVLFTTVDAPGPDDASRAVQIRAALEGLTPYPVEDLIFDWQVQGADVRVAVIARETLAEAEGFATEHRFNPVAFAAAPTSGFAGEPWFGLSALAPSLLAEGETVERDVEPLQVVERGGLAEDITPDLDATVGVTLDLPTEAEAEAEAEAEVMPEVEQASLPEVDFDETLEARESVDFGQSVQDDDLEDHAPDLTGEPILPVEDDVEADFTPAPLASKPRGTSIFGLADDEPTPSAAFRTQSGKPDRFDNELPADPVTALQDTILADPDPTDPFPTDPGLLDFVLEEAPMAVDVEDDNDQLDVSDAAQSKAKVTDLSLPEDVRPEDLAPVPGLTPAMGFASRRASGDDGRSSKVPPPPLRPAIARPTAAKPLAPMAPKAERSIVSRPTAAKPVVAKESKGLRGFGAFVSAPSLPGSRKKKAMISSQAPISPTQSTATASAASTADGASAATKSLGRGFGARSVPVRGKPRHLGLALTALLLLILAVIAAWSTSLAFRSDDSSDTELAALEAPAPDDEMLADGQDPEALADGGEAPQPVEAAQEQPVEDAVETLAVEPAPDALAAGQDTAPAAVVNPGASSGDEIFLAAKDPAPIAPEPLDLPEVAAQGDPLPVAQAPPPPFGTVYQFDANGLIVPTPEGIVTPEGVLLIAGQPPVVPKPRPEGLVPPAADVTALPAADSAATPLVPEGAADPAATPLVAEGTEAPAVTGAAFPSDPALAGFRPKSRPATLVPPAAGPDDAALSPTDQTPGPESRLASLRPLARPQTVLAAGDAVRAASNAAAASLASQAEAKAAEDAAAAPASKLAVTISRKPEARPRDLSRAVEAAVAAAVRTPEPKPEPDPEPTPEPAQKAKVVQPTPKPEKEPEATVVSSSKPPKSGGRDAEEEADEEPELASVSVGKSQGSVAKQATFKNALNLSKTALIGVYGTQSNRYAMIRTEGGRYKKVKIGDKIDGGKIQAITASEVRYQKGSKLVTLAMPKS